MTSNQPTFLSSTEELISEIKNKKLIILVDDKDRENEGDLVFPAQWIQPNVINFMSHHARGLICVALDESYTKRLSLPQMVPENLNSSLNHTAFTVSVEAAEGVRTGISDADRTKTIQVLADTQSQPQDLIRPGHIFPIQARKKGVLERAGHTEASVDICRLAGCFPVAVICEMIAPDGRMARMEQLKAFSIKHQIQIGTIENLIAYRKKYRL